MSALRSLLVLALSGLVLPAPASAGGRTGTIDGTVRFAGKAPFRKVVDRSSDAYCAKRPKADDEVVVTGGKLQGVHVRIKTGTAGKHTAPKEPVVIKQVDCLYTPRVVGAVAGQSLVVENADATMHNVHAYSAGETWWNRSQPKGAPALRESDLGVAGEVFTLKCDVHRWMRAFVPLTDHPFFDVTGEDGRFEIRGVPAGTYTLEAWHPKLGLKSQQITVGAKPAVVSFEFP